MKAQYTEAKTFHFPNMVVKVYRPELTEEERARRLSRIHNQAAKLLRSVKN